MSRSGPRICTDASAPASRSSAGRTCWGAVSPVHTSRALPTGTPRSAAHASLTTASTLGAWGATAPMCTSGAVTSLPSRSQPSRSVTRRSWRLSAGVTASSPPATRSHTAWSWALPWGVKRRYVAGSTAATVITRFWMATLASPSTSVSTTPGVAEMASCCSGVNGSAREIIRSAPASPSASGPGGSTACAGSTTVGVADAEGSAVSEPDGVTPTESDGLDAGEAEGSGAVAGADPHAARTAVAAASSNAPRARTRDSAHRTRLTPPRPGLPWPSG